MTAFDGTKPHAVYLEANEVYCLPEHLAPLCIEVRVLGGSVRCDIMDRRGRSASSTLPAGGGTICLKESVGAIAIQNMMPYKIAARFILKGASTSDTMVAAYDGLVKSGERTRGGLPKLFGADLHGYGNEQKQKTAPRRRRRTPEAWQVSSPY